MQWMHSIPMELTYEINFEGDWTGLFIDRGWAEDLKRNIMKNLGNLKNIPITKQEQMIKNSFDRK